MCEPLPPGPNDPLRLRLRWRLRCLYWRWYTFRRLLREGDVRFAFVNLFYSDANIRAFDTRRWLNARRQRRVPRFNGSPGRRFVTRN